MAITALPTAPSRSSDPSTFADDADTWVAALATFTTEANALQTDVNAKQVTASAAAVAAADSAADAENSSIAAAASAASALLVAGTNATSTSSITPARGSLSFTLAQTGKTFVVGQYVTVADSTTPYSTWFNGAITAFNAGTGAITVYAKQFSGVVGTSWVITASAPVIGGIVTRSIITGQSVAGFTLLNYSTSTPPYKRVNCGSLTANTLTTVFSKTTAPISMSQLAIVTADATARTMRVVVEVDGVTVYDFTSSSNSASERCCILAGVQIYNQPLPLEPIRSESSVVIKVASNLTETDKFYIDYAYQEIN